MTFTLKTEPNRTANTPTSNHPPPSTPTPSQFFATSLHHKEPLQPPTANLHASSPYRATSTLYHKPPLSTNNLQHHLPRKPVLNSLICLTPNPPNSFPKQTVFELIKEIFPLSSHPPQKNLFNKDSI